MWSILHTSLFDSVRRQKGVQKGLSLVLHNEKGFFSNPLAVSVFIGLVLVVSVFGLMERYLMLGQMKTWGHAVIFIAILVVAYGFYRGLKKMKGNRFKKGASDPFYMRSLMADCLEKTCAPLEKRLQDPSYSSSAILNEMLLDKILDIYEKDCMRFTDIRMQFEKSGLKKADRVNFKDFFTLKAVYESTPLVGEIRHVADAIARRDVDLPKEFSQLKKAHRDLFTSLGHYLEIFSPSDISISRLIKNHKFKPPDPDQARRIVFATTTLAYLKSIRYENVKKEQAAVYEDFARQIIPELAGYVKAYRDGWEKTVSAYEEA